MLSRRAPLVFAYLALAACATQQSEQKLLDATLLNYAGVIRWGNIEQAVAFVDPETLKVHPLSTLDLERYHQVQVTAYNEQPKVGSGHEVHQIVEIGLVNVNTQAARAVIDRQLWRYDEKAKRWWLVSGLPDITSH